MTSLLRSGVVGLLLAVVAFATAGAAEPGDAINGLWLTAPSENGRARVEITRTGDHYDGHIVWLEQPEYPPDDPGGMAGEPKVDRENPDPDLRSRPILGLEMVEGFKWDGDETWTGGTIYDPESGKTYKCKAWITKDGDLKVRGYVGISLFGRTTVWTKAKAQPSPSPSPSPQPAAAAGQAGS